MVGNLSRYLAAACLIFFVGTEAVQRRPQRRTPAHIRRNDETVYLPISPSALADVEVRGGGHVGTGDYINQGLSATMNMVAQEYGLRDSESFYWGLDGRPLANLTAFAYGKDVRVLSLERFDNVLETAECSHDSIKLMFAQEVQFDEVQRSWQWVNDADENFIVLVTESSRCNVADGDDTVRQPWHISGADFDDNANTVTLSAEPKTWNQAFASWHLDIDTTGLLPDTNTHRQRRDAEVGGFDLSLKQDLSNRLGFELADTRGTGRGAASMNCVNCTTDGSLDFRFSLDYDLDPGSFDNDAIGLTGAMTVTPRDVKAHVEVQTHVRGGLAFSQSSNLAKFTYGQPGYGRFKIKNVITLAPEVSLNLVGQIEVGGDVDVTTGVDLAVPNESSLTIRRGSEWSADSNGWNVQSTLLPPVWVKSASMVASIAAEWKLSYRAEVAAEIVKASAFADLGVVLAAPKLTLNATAFEAAQQQAYQCNVGSNKYGMSFQVLLGVFLGAFGTAGYDVPVKGKKTAGTTIGLYSTATPLTSTCTGVVDAVIATPAAPVPGPKLDPASPDDNQNGGVTTTEGSYLTGGYDFGSAPCPPGAVDGQLICRPENDGQFGLCNFGTVIWQPVAPGTGCYNGRIMGTGIYAVPAATATSSQPSPTPANGSTGTCAQSEHGLLICKPDDVLQFGLCNFGSIVWQRVADGTNCVAGKIVGTGIYAVPTPTTASI